MKLIVGLGNPGAEYVHTRHNVGWRVLDACTNAFVYEKKFSAAIAKTDDVLYCKPQTFMNHSGIAVAALSQWYDIPADSIVLVYDDIDMPFGTIRLRSAGSAGGHNGVQSIIDHLGTKDIARVRVGIAPTHPIADTANFVLGCFTQTEETHLPSIISAARECVQNISLNGIDNTQHADVHVAIESGDAV